MAEAIVGECGSRKAGVLRRIVCALTKKGKDARELCGSVASWFYHPVLSEGLIDICFWVLLRGKTALLSLKKKKILKESTSLKYFPSR